MSERIFCRLDGNWVEANELEWDPKQGWLHKVKDGKHSVLGQSDETPWKGTAEMMADVPPDIPEGRG